MRLNPWLLSLLLLTILDLCEALFKFKGKLSFGSGFGSKKVKLSSPKAPKPKKFAKSTPKDLGLPEIPKRTFEAPRDFHGPVSYGRSNSLPGSYSGKSLLFDQTKNLGGSKSLPAINEKLPQPHDFLRRSQSLPARSRAPEKIHLNKNTAQTLQQRFGNDPPARDFFKVKGETVTWSRNLGDIGAPGASFQRTQHGPNQFTDRIVGKDLNMPLYSEFKLTRADLGKRAGPRIHSEARLDHGRFKEPGDHFGHIQANRFKGPGDSHNFFAQDGKLNNGPYKQMENTMAKTVEEDPHGMVLAKLNFQEGTGDNLSRPSKIGYSVESFKKGNFEFYTGSFLNRDPKLGKGLS